MENKKIVLAIDDNPVQLDIFKTILSPKYDLRDVKSASEALSFLNKNISDVILLDIEMPNISGFEFLKDIKRIPSYINVPVIVVSGNSGQDFVDKATKCGAANVLSKPVTTDVLIRAIEKALAEHQAFEVKK